MQKKYKTLPSFFQFVFLEKQSNITDAGLCISQMQSQYVVYTACHCNINLVKI